MGKKTSRKPDAAAALLAKAVQSSRHQEGERSGRKKTSKKTSAFNRLARVLKDSKKEDRKRRKGKSRHKRRRVKEDPDGDDPSSDDSGYDDESYEDSRDKELLDESSDSDRSCEAPLRRKSLKKPGSVMELLVRHAQEQVDRGALLDGGGGEVGLTSGIKISTYFSLMIRPYYPAGSPLLRELYALGQTIDLLRGGRLPECADALASRFLAVHTALAEGGWSTASQLELYPLDAVVQSASTSAMLRARRHRRLVAKSQGWSDAPWWGGAGRGRGSWQNNEKGKKGDGKGRGKGKSKTSAKDNSWGKKGDSNPWKDNKEEPPKKP